MGNVGYDATISFGLPFEPEDFPIWEENARGAADARVTQALLVVGQLGHRPFWALIAVRRQATGA